MSATTPTPTRQCHVAVGILDLFSSSWILDRYKYLAVQGEGAIATFSTGCDTTMFQTASSIMSDWSSGTTLKDSHTAEMGGAQSSDEARLATMGYKQELRCVRFKWRILDLRDIYALTLA